MNLTFKIPDDKKDWIIEGLGYKYGYMDMIQNPDFDHKLSESEENPIMVPNNITKLNYVKSVLRYHITEETKRGHAMNQTNILLNNNDFEIL